MIEELITNFKLPNSALGDLTAIVQLGFIAGTLTFALFTVVDRFSPSRIFFTCASMGALFNLGLIWEGNNLVTILCIRFLTGFFLAGIYPVGIKIATDYFEKGLGKSLGYLVGALVLGTALPHLLKDLSSDLSYKIVIIAVTLLALTGGLMLVILVPDGPLRSIKKSQSTNDVLVIFKNKEFRTSTFGYFGHMWELYTFWAFVPAILHAFNTLHHDAQLNPFAWSFGIIAIGALGCIVSGYLSERFGTKTIAFGALFLSFLCCIFSPLIITYGNNYMVLGFLMIWGIFVIADSPMFTTLIAQNTPKQLKGSAITLINCLGYALTIASIQVMSYLTELTDSPLIYLLLAAGPLIALIKPLKEVFVKISVPIDC